MTMTNENTCLLLSTDDLQDFVSNSFSRNQLIHNSIKYSSIQKINILPNIKEHAFIIQYSEVRSFSLQSIYQVSENFYK